MNDPNNTIPAPLRVLVLEDNPKDVQLCLSEMMKAGFEIQSDVVDTEEAFTAKLQTGEYHIILSDFRIPMWSGLDAFKLLQKRGIDIPFILVTGTLGEEAAVQLIKTGISDYILKDRLARLPSAIHRALHEKKIREDRERVIQALRRSEARGRRLIDSNIVGIAIGDLSGRLFDANGAFLKMVGYTKVDVRSGALRWDALTPAEYRESDQKKGDELRTTGMAVPWEKQFLHKDGTRISVLIGITALAGKDGDDEFLSFILDISERKKLEQQLRQAQKMEAIGQLAGGIAHDFNNLLGVIIGYSEILIDRAGDDTKMRSQCEEIKKAGDRAASLTRQLLAFSRQQVLAPVVLNVNSVVVETEKMLRRLIGEHIELQTNLDGSLGTVRADPGQIDQVILNLAVNARDAMPDGGKIVIETSNAELDEDHGHLTPPCIPGRYVSLAVVDTGTGMDDETKLHIFEPFFTTKEPGKGTGLGLSTVYGVVKQSGGYIFVDSEVGCGTSFRVYLPRIDEPVQRPVPREPAIDLLSGTETILLVEDAEAVRALTRSILEDAGYEVVEAGSGAEAFQKAEKYPRPIHLLLTDVVMPGMNGRALAEKITAVHPAMKVMYVSGYLGGFSARGDLLDVGATLVQKPFSRKVLLGKLREVLEPKQ
jgi:two-component system cell cycle sensor histidine kinase/response regulator CckA